MGADDRLSAALNMVQAGFNRVAVGIAALSFWQFLLLAFILLAAAGITEDLWDKPARQTRIPEGKAAASSEERNAQAQRMPDSSAEIRVDDSGITIGAKETARNRGPATAPKDAGTRTESASGPESQLISPPQRVEEQGSKEIRIGEHLLVIRKTKPGSTNPAAPAEETSSVEVHLSGARLPGTDGAVPRDHTAQAHRPQLVALALLLILGLFVMRMFARAQQRAEKKADAAIAVAERESLQRQVAEARLQLLQAQVEPHFLFNSLAAVEHLIETAPGRAAQMQRHLIEYLRAALPRMREQSATLGQEVDLCVSYLKIMQMRMEERLKFDVAVPSGLNTASFPPMMIQSLVENAIRHGVEPKSEGGSVRLHAEVRDGKLRVTVEDTGLGFSTAARTGIGLTNIRERLQQLFGGEAALVIEPNRPCGTRATIAVPYALA